jgi:hypothetical protein
VNVGYVLGGLLSGLALLVVGLLVMSTWLCLRLKRLHNALWISLDKPMPSFDRSRNTIKFYRFLRRGQYKSLDNAVTRRLAAWTWIMSVVLLAYIVAGVAVEFAAIKLAGW